MGDKPDLKDYVDVAERITEFYDRYPEGSLQPANPAKPWEQVIIERTEKNGDRVAQAFVCYAAAAYRTPGDPRPGIGIAWEVFPGRTPYTRGSEVMNAETSAWGRAIASLGIATKRGIASKQEEALARDRQDWWRGPEPASQDCRDGKHLGQCAGGRGFCHQGLPVNRDGTLARSRMSDEQKEELGLMTSEQQKEHTALLPKAGDQSAAVERGIAVSDPDWAGSLDDPEDRPGSAAGEQLLAIGIRFTERGVKDKVERLAQTAALVGRPLASSKELSYREAGQVLLALAGVNAEGAKTGRLLGRAA